MKRISIIKLLFNVFITVFSTIILKLLIFAGAVVSLATNDELLLAILLVIAGISWVYREYQSIKKDRKEEVRE